MKRLLPLAAGLVALAAGLLSQPSAITRTVVHKADVSVPGREAVIVRVEIAPEGRSGRHTHPGEEITYVLEGEGEILIDGKPPLSVKPGSGFVVPSGAKHDAHNVGKAPMKLVAIYYVEKGQPLATPAP